MAHEVEIQLPTDCPPSTANDHSGLVCRLIAGAAPTEKDFISHVVLYPNIQWPHDKLCDAHGLSVTLDLDGAARLRRRVGKLREHNIASATLDGSQGKVAQTGENAEHHTWWPTTGTKFLQLFSLAQVSS